MNKDLEVLTVDDPIKGESKKYVLITDLLANADICTQETNYRLRAYLKSIGELEE